MKAVTEQSERDSVVQGTNPEGDQTNEPSIVSAVYSDDRQRPTSAAGGVGRWGRGRIREKRSSTIVDREDEMPTRR